VFKFNPDFSNLLVVSNNKIKNQLTFRTATAADGLAALAPLVTRPAQNVAPSFSPTNPCRSIPADVLSFAKVIMRKQFKRLAIKNVYGRPSIIQLSIIPKSH